MFPLIQQKALYFYFLLFYFLVHRLILKCGALYAACFYFVSEFIFLAILLLKKTICNNLINKQIRNNMVC